jgi:photosystem II stability/assembly factor-like uncharacterized protein
VRDIEILPWDTATVLVGTWAGLFKTTDGGTTWYSPFLGYDTRCIEIDTNAKMLYVGTRGNGAYKSIDNGETWISIINPEIPTSLSMALDVFDVAVNPQESNNLYLGTGIGPYKSTNGGNSWVQSFAGMKNFYAFDIKISPSNSSIVYAAGGQGVHRSTDHGATWKYIGARGYFTKTTIDPVDANIVYASIDGIDLTYYFSRTTNSGKTWTVASAIHSLTFIPFIEIDRSPQRAVYTSTYNQFLRSFDFGLTWETIQAPIIPISIAIANDNPNLLYIGSRFGEVYKSLDRGETWDSLALATSGNQTTVFLNPLNSQTVYARIFGKGIYKSTDGGLTWMEKNNGLESLNYNISHGNISLVNPINPEEIFLVTDNAIYQTLNGGDEWQLMELNLPSSTVFTLALVIDTTGGKKFFAGSNRFPGVYMLDLITSVEENNYQQLPRFIELHQNYPNPFNPSTVIEFTLPHSANVVLEIFDMLGRRMKTLLNARVTNGLHSMSWDGTNEKGELMATGMYIYRLTADTYRESKKMMFIH